mmetsp:Transcript_11853/g.14101  ORF Transcript_11853/g.14101 Transcript_11853/m.14101 type:complete len:267 (+) Transcript_11853:270-1070(+)|eukprot:CAMPEP_0197847016 /NCGR_PEP_ID=MMETSP1438-20131217/4995_1 /TAXON_ID=1461541 /ORGANISM="Pterosperma sp., Strain CCMP1384" /LENGTH=266 /DNA_ID=CAMNT_0043458821 /DNA_START=266 /DNA_END=1066 /DNA_ORIENTATION=+
MGDLTAQTIPILDAFKAAFQKGEIQKSHSLLNDLKLRMTEFSALPPFFEESPSASKQLLIAREVLETAVLLSVKAKDQDMFQRQYAQLKTFYTDTRSLMPISQHEFPILGLNLLRLLVQNRTAEFHTELELISPENQQNVYIKHAIDLEQYLMEGAYNRVISAHKDMPSETYEYFMDMLMETVRDEMAASCEKAYCSLSIASLKEMLMLGSDAEVQSYAKERGWTLINGEYQFQEEGKTELTSKDIPSNHLINLTLTYAKELERIV